MTNQYDVQILKDGEWTWSGVIPMPRSRKEARLAKKRMESEPFWKAVGAVAFRVHQTGFTTKGIRLG